VFPQNVGISYNKHALIIPPLMGQGRRIHPMPNSDSSVPCNLSSNLSADILVHLQPMMFSRLVSSCLTQS